VIRAAIYARVSSAAQRERHTIENQLRVLPAFVASQGWALAGTYVDDGRSAKSGLLEQREGFARLITDAELKMFDVLVVVDVDRLTRTDSLEERARILGPFQRLGIDIVTPSGGRLDMRTMLGELWITIQALGAAEENRKRGERIKAGKARAIAEGRKPAGPTPYGLHYDRELRVWSIDEAAAGIVREIYERVAGGESCVQVADDLVRRGMMRGAKPWTVAAVYRCMATRYTCGEWTVDKKRGVAIAVPRILSDELWLRAQQSLQRAQRRGLDRTKHVYLLQGIARCTCGEPIVIRSGVKYYNAQHQAREHPAAYLCRSKMQRRPCGEPIVYCRELDDRVWAALCAELEQPDLIDALAQAEVRQASDARDWAADAEGYRAHLQRLNRVEADFLHEYRRGEISKEAWAIERPRLERERQAVRRQLETALQAQGSLLSAHDRLQAASSTVARLRAALPLAKPEHRRELLRELARDGGVVVAGGRARLDLRLVRGAAADVAHLGESPLRVVPPPV